MPARPDDTESPPLPPPPATETRDFLDPDATVKYVRPAAAAATPLLPSLPGYEVLGVLGRGGMGVVYKARHLQLGRVTALKMILSGGHAGEADLARFRTEAEAVARLQHPNIVQIFEVGEHGGLPFFSLEFCPGGSLDRKLNGTPLPPGEAAALVEKLARAVQAAHDKGVVHRDLKPANVLLAEGGEPKITDFGLAKKLDAAGQTQSGAAVGTPSYMAPEQAAGKSKEIGPAADVYALGAILYECLTGRPPFKAATVTDTLMQVVTDDPAPPRRLQPKTPRDLETICLKCLEKQPGRRYAAARDLADDLRRFLADEPVRARPVGGPERVWKWARRRPARAAAYGLLLAALVLGVGGGGATGLWLQSEQARGVAESARRRAETAEEEVKQSRNALQAALEREQDAKRRLAAYSYADRIYLAQQRWDAGHWTLARDLLREAADLQDGLAPGPRPWEWHYLNRVLHPELAVLEGHTGAVVSVAFSPDGGRVATASYDKTARLWDAASGKELAALEGHTGLLHAVTFSPDGRRVATAGFDKTARLWDAASGKPLAVLKGHAGQIYSVAFSPDGRRVATAGDDHTARLWDAASGEPFVALEGHTDIVWSVAFSPDGGRVATGSVDGTARLWDATSGKQLSVLEKEEGYVRCVAFSPDGGRIVLARRNEARLCDAASGKSLAVLKGHADQVFSATFSPDGRRVATASYDMTARLWDAASGRQLAVLKGHTRNVECVAFSPDGDRVATASDDQTARLWDAATGEPFTVLPGISVVLDTPIKQAPHLAFSADGRRVATAGDDTTARLWDAASGKPLVSLKGHTQGLRCVCFSADGRRVATTSLDRTARLWDASSGQPLAVLDGHGNTVVTAAFRADEARVATVDEKNTIHILDIADGKSLAVLESGPDALYCVAFSPDAGRVATGNGTSVRLWDAASGKQLAVLDGHMAPVFSVAFSPDGGRVATASLDGTARLWDATSGKQLAALQEHTNMVFSVAYSPDGGRVATASLDGTARLWDAASGKALAVLRGHTKGVVSVAFSPDGDRIATGSWDGTVRLWVARESQEDLDKRRRFWREQQADDAEKAGQWFAAVFHLSRLIDAGPPDASLYTRRGNACARQGQWAKAAADLLQGAALRQPAAEADR